MANDEARTALDPEIVRLIAERGLADEPDLAAMQIEDALKCVRFPMPAPLPANAEDHTIALETGRALRVRLYFPAEERAGLPILLHLHGGGFVTGTIELDDARCVALARQATCIVASVDYGLAPERPFPAAIEDAHAAWTWLAASASAFGGDPHRMAVSGSSAGGHIAVGLCLMVRERGGPAPLLQLLTYPVIDPRMDSPSYRAFAEGPFLAKRRMAWFWDQYRAGQDPKGPLWTPLTAKLAGLPPAHIVTAGFDVLRDEAEAYAAALADAGAAVSVRRHDTMIHGFIAIAPGHPETAKALEDMAAALRRAFAGSIR